MKKIAALLFIVCFFISCIGHKAPKSAPPPSPPPKKTEAKLLTEIDKILAQVEQMYLAGEKNYKEGHLYKAKQNFDGTVITLLDAHTKYPNDQRIIKTFDTYVEKIHNYELDAIEAGDVFAEEAVKRLSSIK